MRTRKQEEEVYQRKVVGERRPNTTAVQTHQELWEESKSCVLAVWYQTCADLTAVGLSIPDSIKEINVVSNKMYGQKFKAAEESQVEYDTAPAAHS